MTGHTREFFDVSIIDGVVVITLKQPAAPADSSTPRNRAECPPLWSRFSEDLESVLKNAGKNVVVDFAGLEEFTPVGPSGEELTMLVSTPMNSVFINAKKRVDGNGGELRFCGLSPEVREAYRSLRLDEFFRIETSVVDAVASLPRSC